MIRIVTAKRLALLEADAHAAFERARQANEAVRRRTNELARAMEELSAAQQELLRKDIEIRRLREELEGTSLKGRTLTVLMHYGEPHTIYPSLKDAFADTATHGVSSDAGWAPAGERPAAEVRWRCEPFIYNADSNGFRRVYAPDGKPIEEAA